MFEVGQSWIGRWWAREADLPAPVHALSAGSDERNTAAPKGPYRVEQPFDEPAAAAPRAAPFLSARARRLRLIAGALALGLALGAVEEGARRSGYAPDIGRFARAAGFGIDQVTLKGHAFTFDRDIFDALDLGNVRTFAALDTAAVKARIERLPWIDTAALTRIYPGRLDIVVTERKPFAVWTRADRHYLIDKTGRVLGALSGDSLPDLPRFAGEGAAGEAAAFMATLARYPAFAGAFAEAERISGRRWRLRLANAVTVELPADGEVGALEALDRDEALKRLLSGGHATVDFRGPGRLAVRREAPPSPTGPAPGAGS